MSDSEVKIHVSADADLKGIEKTQQEIAKLHNAAKAYESKGMTTAASSARADARVLERDVARFTKERAAAEKAVTKEVQTQHALKKAHIPISQRQASQSFALGREIISGGNPATSAGSLLASVGVRSGNPLVMAATFVVAAAAGIASVLAQETDKDKEQSLRLGGERANEKFQQQRNWGIAGSSAAFRSDALEAEQDAAKRRNDEPRLAEKARQKWYAPSTWEWGGLRKNEGRREQEMNQAEIAADLARQAADRKLAPERFLKSEGGLELDALRQHSKRSLAGSQAEFADKEIGKAFAEYKAKIAEGADAGTAKEMATMTYQNDLRDRQAQAGAGLVDARTGAGGAAAAAQWALQVNPNESTIKEGLDRVVAAIDTPPIKNHAK
jgi:hypothetical protein